MIVIEEPFSPEQFYPGICPTDRNLLFFDIETTGFSREYHMIYLIGAASCQNGSWQLLQWFAETPHEEPLVIQAFFDYAAQYDTLIHFNGQRFDLPFTQARAAKWQIPWTLEFEESIDLMNLIKPYKTICGLENCRQKSIENLLGLSGREDTMNGGELISVYHSYLKTQNRRQLQLLLLHNADDVRGMTALTQVALWPDFFHSSFQFQHAERTKEGMVLQFKSPLRLPILQHAELDYWQLCVGGNLLSLAIPAVETELKHFYPNYKDYYYLPDEDLVVHKSIAEFVDSKHRKKATRQNCCIKQQGIFLPQPDPLITPEFREKPDSKICWFSADNWEPDAQSAETYLHKVLTREIKDF